VSSLGDPTIGVVIAFESELVKASR